MPNMLFNKNHFPFKILNIVYNFNFNLSFDIGVCVCVCVPIAHPEVTLQISAKRTKIYQI